MPDHGKFITPEEFGELLAAIPEEALRDRVLVRLLWETGGRVSELIAITRDDLKNGTVRLRTKKRRDGHMRVLPLPDDLYAELLQLCELRGRQPLRMNRATAWRIVTKYTGLVGLTKPSSMGPTASVAYPEDHPLWPHGLRHSFAHAMKEAVGRLDLLQEALGHKRISSTEKYGRPTTQDVVRAVRAKQAQERSSLAASESPATRPAAGEATRPPKGQQLAGGGRRQSRRPGAKSGGLP